jgi:hypothetical protein
MTAMAELQQMALPPATNSAMRRGRSHWLVPWEQERDVGFPARRQFPLKAQSGRRDLAALLDLVQIPWMD